MKKLAGIFLVSIFSFTSDVCAQIDNYSEKSQKTNYKSAELNAKKARTQLKMGNMIEADSMIRNSIAAYPTLEVYNYATDLMKLSDIKGSNIIMDLVFERVKQASTERLIIPQDFTGILMDMRKVTVLHEHAIKILKTNKAFGNRESIKLAYDRFMENQISYNTGILSRGSIGDDNFYKPRIAAQFEFRFQYWVYNEKYDEALGFIEEKPEKGFTKKEDYQLWKVFIMTEMQEYDKALNEAESLKKEIRAYFSNYIELLKGNADKVDSYFKEYYKNVNPEVSPSKVYYDCAIIDIYNKRYDAAITKLTIALEKRGRANFFGFSEDEYPWKLYKAFGDAYTGLEKYDKAFDHYKISLLCYPDFRPAKEAMASLEVMRMKGVLADKEPPTVTITEPSPKRGLKIVTADNHAMIKGIANDAFGVKEVSVNGQKMFVQSSGDFWGDVPMETGLNKIKVIATDLAGNKTEKTFEIEKQSVQNANAIVPVSEEEGKNYCLLIAAQNYTDNAIPSLENPIADAIKLKLLLNNDYNFNETELIKLFNPSVADIKRQLLELVNTLKPEDDLVIFYAGHGIWVDKEKKGYWLLTDSKYADVNTWLPNKDVLDLIAKLPSRHALLITDACFSGSVFKTRGLKPGAPAAIKEMGNKISRVAITSGNDTEVPDQSVFMKYLIKALSDNSSQYLTAQKMFITQIIEAVMTETKTEPRYGTLESAGHVGGDFIFSKK